eukprot:TRINITY_DN10190_c0_g1_i1.p1 TRINITY_DN10190_c0_g1~~TRINITY_DN10190_c0_g1_i1.p1  ORF type:complete len:252 (-),score=59.76 TRINITY_DN10190_c0_g1_i1:23-778(-)
MSLQGQLPLSINQLQMIKDANTNYMNAPVPTPAPTSTPPPPSTVASPMMPGQNAMALGSPSHATSVGSAEMMGQMDYLGFNMAMPQNPYFLQQLMPQNQQRSPYYHYGQIPPTNSKELGPLSTPSPEETEPNTKKRKRTTPTAVPVAKEDNKQRHNLSERKRRDKINKLLEELRGIVPNCESSKSSILESATDHILKLKDKSIQLENANKELAAENAQIIAFVTKHYSLPLPMPVGHEVVNPEEQPLNDTK